MRQRQTLVEEAATRIQRMQKALTEMNLKLHTVLTDLTGQARVLWLLGGHGFVKEHPVERWYRDLRAISIIEGGVLV